MRPDSIHHQEFHLTPDYGLSPLERQIVDAFRGGVTEGDPEGLIGNRAKSWGYYHPRSKPETAKKRGSEFFQRQPVKDYMEMRAREMAAIANINAATVLIESMEMLAVAKGEQARNDVHIDKDGNITELRYKKYDTSGVKSALDLIGKNVHVKAFNEDDDASDKLTQGIVLMPATLHPDEWKRQFSPEK